MLPSSDDSFRPPTADLELIGSLDDVDDLFWAPATVSIWIGSFPSIDLADAYFEETYRNDATPISKFAGDFGFRGYRSDCLEYHFEQPDVIPVQELIALCSFSESYAAQALAAAAELGIDVAQGLALLFNFDFRRGTAKPQANACLRFLGAFGFQMETGIPWLDRITARTGRHPAAYLTVLDALRGCVGKHPSGTLIDARMLCERIQGHAVETYGALARDRLFQFGLVSSEVVGEVVEESIAEGLLHRQEGDTSEKFRGLFTLDGWFTREGR